MKIDCISDLHGSLPQTPGGDVLIVAGDCTARDTIPEWLEFLNWFKAQKYKKKILVAGNHDGCLAQCRPLEDTELEYLCDSGCEFEGMKFWGSPWTPKFGRWYFMKTESELGDVFSQIPQDVDVLITHGPPYGILDKIDGRDEHVGSKALNRQVLSREMMPQLKLHVFGHIHEQGGKEFDTTFVKFVNCSYMDEYYLPANGVKRVIL